MNSISDICYEHIYGDFWYGSYGEFKVIINKDNSYINGSKLCCDGGKLFKNWFANDSSKRLIHALTQQLSDEACSNSQTNSNMLRDGYAGIQAQPLKCIVKVMTICETPEDKLIRGTYIHMSLVPHVACWISAQFALKVSKIVNNYLVQEYKTMLHVMQQQVTHLQDELITSTALAIDRAIKQDSKIVTLSKEVQDKDNKRIVAVTALDSKKHELNSWASSHAFSILNLNDAKSLMPYYVIRCKRRQMATTVKHLRRRHPQAQIIFQHRRIPNAVNMFDKLRSEKLIKSHRNYCMPTDDEASLLASVTAMCSDQFPPNISLPLHNWVVTKSHDHKVSLTPPASPPPQDTQSYICPYCSKLEPTQMHLYIHQVNCSMNNNIVN
jgi:hypothetical protein